MFERYTNVTGPLLGRQENVRQHDAVLLARKGNGTTELICYNESAIKGVHGRVIGQVTGPGPHGPYSTTGATGSTITITSAANDHAQMILPIQIKSLGSTAGHKVYLLNK